MRKPWLFLVLRVLSAGLIVLADSPVEQADEGPALFGALAVGAGLQVVALVGRGRTQSVACEAGLIIDILVLGLVVDATGGPRSPFLPLVAIWTTVIVMTHRTLTAFCYTAALVVGVVLLTVARPVAGDGFWNSDTSSLALVAIATILVAAATSEYLASSLWVTRQDLRRLSTTDALTGLGNRARFDERLEQCASAARRNGTIGSLVILDLDKFKAVNDTYGHQTGDQLLRVFARTLTGSLRLEDEAFRIGGDEFAILSPTGTSASSESMLRRFRLTLNGSNETVPSISFSAGIVALTGLSADNAEREGDVFAAADRAMYADKRSGVGHDVMAEAPPRPRHAIRDPDAKAVGLPEPSVDAGVGAQRDPWSTS